MRGAPPQPPTPHLREPKLPHMHAESVFDLGADAGLHLRAESIRSITVAFPDYHLKKCVFLTKTEISIWKFKRAL